MFLRTAVLSDRRNIARRSIVVIADEAHRSQYDFIDGFARHMRDALPQASFVGFTAGSARSAPAAHSRCAYCRGRSNPLSRELAVPKICNQIVIDRSVEEVFDYVAADAKGEFTSPKPGGVSPGPRPGDGSGPVGWTKLDRPHLLESQSQDAQFRVYLRLEFEPVGDGTLLTSCTDLRIAGMFGFMAGLYMRLARRSVTSGFQAGLEDLKRSIESSHP